MPLSRHESSPASSACAGPCCQHACGPGLPLPARCGSSQHRQRATASTDTDCRQRFCGRRSPPCSRHRVRLFPSLFSSGTMLHRLPRRLAPALPAFARAVPIIHARLFGMEPALPHCSLLQTNLSPCPCPCGTGAAQQQFSPSVPPLHGKLFGAPERTLSSRSLRFKIAVAQRRAAVTAGRCRGRKGRSPKAKGSSS
jgi:hypothetical protein